MAERLVDYFAELDDPRDRRGVRHLLPEMMVIAVCAVICGADDRKGVAAFGRAKQKWFAQWLRLPHGIPSRFTFERVFAAMDREALERCFGAWFQALAEVSEGRLVAIDGKTLRGSFDRADAQAAIHMISAWAVEHELVFGQLATEANSNEITAMARLLELLDLQGATVTIDAEGCQKDIAAKIVDQGGDYVLALKANHPTLLEEVRLFMEPDFSTAGDDRAWAFHEQIDGEHGRIETRRLWCTPEVAWCEDRAQWAGLRSFVAVERQRTLGDETTCERHYFPSSLDGTDAQRLAHAIRSHWSIENKLHWALDVSFGEDHCRVRKGHGAENFSRLRRIALNLLRRDQTAPLGIKNKRLLASWDHDYLLKLLTG